MTKSKHTKNFYSSDNRITLYLKGKEVYKELHSTSKRYSMMDIVKEILSESGVKCDYYDVTRVIHHGEVTLELQREAKKAADAVRAKFEKRTGIKLVRI